MASTISPLRILTQAASALLTRLDQVKPFALQQPAVPAAQIPRRAQTGIERYLERGRRELRAIVRGYLYWLEGGPTPAEAQRRYAILRLKFNAVLTQFDVFADVLTQRSEHTTGVWLSGLDVLAADALALEDFYRPPPVICYLDRGAGAAIRRARTRLPGGGKNPVAIVRIPRERMVGSGIGSSLIHEVGHQATALLGLVDSLRPVLRAHHDRSNGRGAWQYWERWISEILADFWSVARLGIGSTLGLMGVVSLPKAFVFRVNLDDPHPVPWIRVKLSCGMGQALFPHPQWGQVARLWNALYPKQDLPRPKRRVLDILEEGIPAFVQVLIDHRPPSLEGRSLPEVMNLGIRQPERLALLFKRLPATPQGYSEISPSMVFAVLGQAKFSGHLQPQGESRLLTALLTHWALHRTPANRMAQIRNLDAA